jgi:hypothetical protein
MGEAHRFQPSRRRPRRLRRLAALLGALGAALCSCGGSSSSGDETGYLEGIVVDSLGGSAVPAATVAFRGKTATTDAGGRFSLSVPAGTADVLVSKSGRAGSRMQSVKVVGRSTTSIELVEPVFDHSATDVAPPTISAGGIAKGASYSGAINISVSVAPGSCPVVGTDSHRSIYIRTGDNYVYNSSAAYSNGDSLSFSCSASSYPAGTMVFRIVAYDNNNNRSELAIPVKIVSNTSVVPDANALSGAGITAYTFGTNAQMLQSVASEPGSGLALERIVGASGGNSPSSAQEDSSVYVIFDILWVSGASGIKIYSSDSSSGPWSVVGSSNLGYSDSDSKFHFRFYDTSARLTPGTVEYYKVAYYNGSAESTPSAAVSVPILGKYNINLTSPANEAAIATTTPTFAWTAQGTVSPLATRYDEIEVYRETSNSGSVWDSGSLADQTSATCAAALSVGARYRWNVWSRYEYASGVVASYSYPQSGKTSYYTDSANNGWFTFGVTD